MSAVLDFDVPLTPERLAADLALRPFAHEPDRIHDLDHRELAWLEECVLTRLGGDEQTLLMARLRRLLEVHRVRIEAPERRARLKRLESHFTYAIQSGKDGPIKIGIADKPWDRIATLQQGNPEELIGLAAWRGERGERGERTEEQRLHARFAHARIRGEWFRPVPELVRYVLREGGVFCNWERPDPDEVFDAL